MVDGGCGDAPNPLMRAVGQFYDGPPGQNMVLLTFHTF